MNNLSMYSKTHYVISRANLLRSSRYIAAGLIATGLLTSGAAAETRSLKILNIHTREQDTIMYERNGRYLPAGLGRLNYLLRDWRQNKQINIDPHVLDVLWQVYQESGSRDYIHIVCGYRTAQTNSMLRGRSRASGVAKESQHIRGKAIDFYLPDVPLEKVREIGLKLQDGGVGYYPRSGAPFVHMDTGGVRAWPRMTRQQLVRLFPRGRTLHLPPDGQPLPGYQEAALDYKRRMSNWQDEMAGSSKGSDRTVLATLFGTKARAKNGAAPSPVASQPPAMVMAAIDPAALPIPTARPDAIVTASISGSTGQGTSVASSSIQVAGPSPFASEMPVPVARPVALSYVSIPPNNSLAALHALKRPAPSMPVNARPVLTAEAVTNAGRKELRKHPNIMIALADLNAGTTRSTTPAPGDFPAEAVGKASRLSGPPNNLPDAGTLNARMIIQWASSHGMGRNSGRQAASTVPADTGIATSSAED